MATYRIDVSNGGNTGTVVPDVSWKYSKQLNQVNEAELKFSATGATNRALLQIGAEVTIYKDGTIDFIGLIDTTDYFIGGTVVFHASGYETWLAKENGTYTNSPWTSTASATIFAAIITESSYLSAGTINTGFDTDYRLAGSQSLFNAISNLANKTTQDISIDYTASPVEISILDHVGSATSVAVWNEAKEITNLRRSVGYPRGNSIIVYGKGDGDNQIKGTASDATSIAAYGTITKIVTDRSAMSDDEANSLAAAELALNKDPPNIYDFELTNPEMTGFVLGDVVTLNALDQDVNNDDVRIVGIEEGENKGEAYITLQTTNPELKTLMRTRNKYLAKIQKDHQDDNTYMQGSGNQNLFGSGINAKTGQSLKIPFYISGSMVSESGALNITAINVSYDLDPFNNQVGGASFDGSDPQVQNDSENNDEYSVIAEDDDDVSTGTLSDSWTTLKTWSNVASIGQYIVFYVGAYVVDHTDTSAFSVHVRIKNTDSGDYFPNATGVRLVRGEMPFDTSTVDAHAHTVFVTFASSATIVCPINPYLLDFEVQFKQDQPVETANVGAQIVYDVESRHKHDPGAYDVKATDLDNISIGDDISEAASVNATSVNLYLDFWNGTAWVNKVTITDTTKAIDTGVDISDSGDFPDAQGWWRVRVEPRTVTPDYAQAKVELKNYMDN